MSSTQETSTISNNKLYVGNIEYSTTKSELKDLFKDYEIETIQIPLRPTKARNGRKGKPKSKGYVFVTFGPEVTDLDSIIEKFNNFEFKDRKIYLSRPALREESSTEESTSTAVKKEEKKSVEKPAAASKTTPTTTTKKTTPASSKPKNVTKEKIPFEKGTKSIDTIYLKNLDFQTEAKELRTFFTEEGEEVRWVSVPFKRLPQFVLKKIEAQGKEIQKRNKGYAFIRFKLNEGETIDDKVAKYQGKDFKGRALEISVAVDLRNAEGDDNEEEKDVATEAETVNEEKKADEE